MPASNTYRYPVIGVVGNGTVGSAVAASYRGVTEVRVYDRDPARSTHPLPDVLSAGIVFVCLPTPREPGTLRCDTSALNEFLGKLWPLGFAGANVVIRSTVDVGYTRRFANALKLNLIHSPEFLTARTAEEDAADPRLNVIGVPNGWPGKGTACPALQALYVNRFPTVGMRLVSSDDSETLKLAMNAFFATKVSFFNELSAFCSRKGIDFGAVRDGIISEGRVHPLHTSVPGPDGRRGFGGACLPKDLANFIDCLETAGVSAPVSRAALGRNELDRGGE